ncbi:hypothetical protein [Thermosulfurimonas dismutans]|uniref:TubC N-terminal docking domain-containing protein n=1 Tax=Thermosulfurimonas dismutans TaxID=999894 RepID=A0A179D2Q4_9BACT|nr:hypothetical protein [Thermosulfurimonas dismutans]OAQ20345.1 hypothetical protein TDIS_1540 [Thermosulfurimonas dismutans]
MEKFDFQEPKALISYLRFLGVRLRVEGERLIYESSLFPLSEELLEKLRKNKEALKAILKEEAREKKSSRHLTRGSKTEEASREGASSIRFYRGISWFGGKPCPWPERDNESLKKVLARKPASELPRRVAEFEHTAILAEGKPFFPLAWWLHGVSLPELLKAEPEAQNLPIYEVRGEEVVLVHDPRKAGDCPEGMEHPHRCKLGELVEAQERISGYEWKCRKLKAPCPAYTQSPLRPEWPNRIAQALSEEQTSSESPDEETRELTEKLKSLLRPLVLGFLASKAPIQIDKSRSVLNPQEFIKRTVSELSGRGQVREAAKERARRFLKAIRPLLQEIGKEV